MSLSGAFAALALQFLYQTPPKHVFRRLMEQISNDFSGTSRFRIRRRLGSGGMGIVYEAHDKQTDRVVALKALTRTEASHISRFKQEFRSLADVSHPNLVALYELMADGQYWFFTMELVDGVNFLEYVRPGYKSRKGQTSITDTLRRPVDRDTAIIADYEAETQELDSIDADFSLDSSPELSTDTSLSRSRLDLNRLYVAVRQLAEGLHALHQTGKLHRDIKPSNVLVTNEGRVVVLDFGLVAEIEGQGVHDSANLAGTPDYMSPEQGAQLPISEASDWYSVGVMLYQALTGQLPFTGKFFEVMVDKQNVDPPEPAELVRGLPPELNDLCVRLLAREAQKRPSGRDVLRVLGHGKTGPLRLPLMPSLPTSAVETFAFVGRDKELEQIQQAFAATRAGETVTMFVHGSSGMGKTALLRNFLDQLRRQHKNVVVLEGRCYERESVPYKAIDGVIDSLTRYLTTLPPRQMAALMPPDVLALARLFPVMLQIDSVFDAPKRPDEVPDPFTQRRLAFSALRDLLRRISARHPLIIYIDDLQWSDADSTTLIEDLLRPPDSPPLLLLASFRSEDLVSRGFLRALLDSSNGKSRRELEVAALSRTEAHRLVRLALASNVAEVEPFVDSIVREGRGNPFLLEQLARYAATNEEKGTTGITLAVMVEARLRHLPRGARPFLETLAIAGRPINPEIAYQAAGLTGDDLPLVSSLRAAQFVRSGSSEHTVELYHDRIRETFTAQLDQAKVKHLHRRLAQAIETRGFDDPESLFEHYLAAGERVRAATHAAVAAKKAASALAFDRAAAFYRHALEFAPVSGVELIEMKGSLAETLVNAGRPAEAAQAFLELAKDTSASRSLEFRRRAAEQLLMGGHISEGMQLMQEVLAAVGISMPEGPTRALLSLLLKRIQIRLRGFDFTERDVTHIPEAELARIDTCWSVAAGLGAVDLVRGADFHCRHLLLALRAGEPLRVAKAMCFETAQTASRGVRARRRALQIAERAEALAHRVGHPHAIALASWARGVAAYLIGHWREAAELCDKAANILRNNCTGVTWELATANRFMLSALQYRGELAEVSRRVPALLSAAVEQGNLFAATDLRTRMNLIWLAMDDPTRARAEVIEAMGAWPQRGFHLQHYTSLFALVQNELYTGDGEVAWKHIQGQWKALQQSMLLRIQVLRIEAMHLQARAALASSAETEQVQSRLRIADAMADRIAKERMTWSLPLVSLIRAGLAHQRGQPDEVRLQLSSAVENFTAADMDLYAAAGRRRLGQVLGDERGEELVAEADAWMKKQKIMNPERMARMLAPGFE